MFKEGFFLVIYVSFKNHAQFYYFTGKKKEIKVSLTLPGSW